MRRGIDNEGALSVMSVGSKGFRWLLVVAIATSLVAVSPASAAVGGQTFTYDADFAAGTLTGVEYTTVADQLQLSQESVTLPFIWVPNLDGTVSKLDTVSGKELARYRVGPSGRDLSPSRTTVDLNGCCWVGNRQVGTAVKIGLVEADYWVDRNGNGVCDTSKDLNNDGTITPGMEMLPWGADEAVLAEVTLIPGNERTFVPGTNPGIYANDYWNPGPRSLAISADNDVWIGCYGTSRFYEIDGTTSVVKRQIQTPGHTPYGAVIDGDGVIWSAGLGSPMAKVNPNVDPATVQLIRSPEGAYMYGVALDGQGHVIVGGDNRLRAWTIATNTWAWNTVGPGSFYRGIAVTDDGDIWVADTNANMVWRYSSAGVFKAGITMPANPTGVAVDAAGKVWACMLYSDHVVRINPAMNGVDFMRIIPGSGGHYSYSDMTGIVARNVTTKIGTWRGTADAGHAGASWDELSWNAAVPDGAALTVKARSSDDGVTFSAWDDVASGEAPVVPAGRYLEFEVRFVASPAGESPVLFDLTARSNEPPVLTLDAANVGCCEGDNAVDGFTCTDPDGDALSITATCGTIEDLGGGSYRWVKPEDDGPFSESVTITADDGNGGVVTASFDVAVTNLDPTCGTILGPGAPVALGTPISVTVPFTDPGSLDTHTCSIDWGDGTTSAGAVTEADGDGSAVGTHTYAAPDVYTVTATVTDKDGGTSTCAFRYAVVYDPAGGFVTGGGTIMSPEGAYTPDTTLSGKANFGFVSKYLKGATVPKGNTEFVFHAGGMNFSSTSYEWLVIAGAKAQYKGLGTINGAGEYRFMLTAIDGQVTGGGGVDRIRIRIWDAASGDVIYDNEIGAAPDAAPTTAINSGSIVVHKAK